MACTVIICNILISSYPIQSYLISSYLILSDLIFKILCMYCIYILDVNKFARAELMYIDSKPFHDGRTGRLHDVQKIIIILITVRGWGPARRKGITGCVSCQQPPSEQHFLNFPAPSSAPAALSSSAPAASSSSVLAASSSAAPAATAVG